MGKNISNKDLNLGIIVEAKQEYTKQLCNVMKPIIYEGLFTLYTNALDSCESEDDILVCFQKELKNVPKWNSDVIGQETERIIESCNYFNDLITAVFLSNVRILTSVKLGSSRKKIQLTVPTNQHFVHTVYVNVCKSIYNDPYLFSIKKYNGNVTNNINEVLALIESSISDTIRDMLPIKNILESYLGDTMETDETFDDSVDNDTHEEYDEPHEEHEPISSNEIYDEATNPPDIDEDPTTTDVNPTKPIDDKSPVDALFETPQETKDICLGGERQTNISEHDDKKATSFFDDEDIKDNPPSTL